MIDTQQILKQLDSVLERYYRVTQDSSADELSTPKMKELITSAHAAIERLAPPGSPYQANCAAVLGGDAADPYAVQVLIGIVAALRHDFEAGGLLPIQDLIRAEVFDDFLEMAEHLLSLSYKDPAAVLAGGVLEQHLRRLCIRRGIPTDVNGKPKKADTMNADLAGAGAYSKLDQKSVTSWQDLRNRAAHGEYETYNAEQVRLLLLGVRDFMARTRA
jgi:hypothetical protein